MRPRTFRTQRPRLSSATRVSGQDYGTGHAPQNDRFGTALAITPPERRAASIRRILARLHHGPVSRRVIALAATGQLGMTAAGQIRLAVVTGPDQCDE